MTIEEEVDALHAAFKLTHGWNVGDLYEDGTSILDGNFDLTEVVLKWKEILAAPTPPEPRS